MGTKLKPGSFDCYASALPDEPLFTLLARDPLAPILVSIWSSLRYQDEEAARAKFEKLVNVAGEGWLGATAETFEKASEALDCAMAMFAWRKANEGAWRQ